MVESLTYQLNEVKPLLYAVLKLGLVLNAEQEKIPISHQIQKLDDFLKHDPNQELLMPLLPGIYKPVEMLARVYVQQNIKYTDESEYWLDYASLLAQE